MDEVADVKVSMTKVLVFLLVVAILMSSFTACSPVDRGKTAEEITTERAKDEFCDQKYGIFVHYAPFYSADKYGKGGDIQTTADGFDAAGFARDIASTGADYIIFTAWHARMNLLYPSQVMEQYRPGHCSQRDVIGDMLDALEPYGVDVWLYTHPYLGYHMSETDRISTGYGVGSHPVDTNKPNPETFQYDKWNGFINAVYGELVDRYAGRIKGLFLDEGIPSAGMDEFIDFSRLRRTIKEADPSILMMQNFYGTTYSCDLGMKEYGPGWGEFSQANEGLWPCYEVTVGVAFSQDWMAKRSADVPVVRYTAQSMFRYTVLQAGCNTDGGGCSWAAGLYVGGGWEKDVLSTLQQVGTWYTQRRESLAGTRPSTSYPLVSGTTINQLPYGIVATQSTDGKKEYIHVLTPPEGKTLYLPLPGDGKVFDGAYLLEGGVPVSLTHAPNGVAITLPEDATWDELDTVLVLSVSQQDLPEYQVQYIRDTDVGIVYEGAWEYSRWERNCGDYEGDMHQSNEFGAGVSYTFTGVGVAWLTSCSPEQGEVDIWVDDEYQGTYSAYASTYKAQRISFRSSVLPYGTHTIRLKNKRGRICVDGFIVMQ